MKRRICSSVLCFLLITALVTFLASCGGTAVNSTFRPTNQPMFSDNNTAEFREQVYIAQDPDEVQKNFKEAYLNSSLQYTLEYRNKVPDFFATLNAGDIFCIYPDKDSNIEFFQTGFCGKMVQLNTQEPPYTVTFEIPQAVDVFKKLQISTANASPRSVAFRSSTGTQAGSGVLSMGDTALSSDLTIPLGDSTVNFKRLENDRTALMPDFQILCRQLKIRIRSSLDQTFNISGDVTLDYPSLKFLLDYSYDETTDSATVNDFEFDFITRETVNLTFSGTQKLSPFSSSSDLTEKISPVNIVDVTESEEGKYVLGTLLIGYEVKLPELINPQNQDNDVSYLSLGIAVQLAVTAAGELTMECNYDQASLLRIHADHTDCHTELKGYDHPHPVIESAEPNGSWAQETPNVSSSYRGDLSFNAGLSVDVGLCVLGMIPMKLCNGIDVSYQAAFSNSEKQNTDEKQIIENSYIVDHSLQSLKIDVYSTLKFHLGVSIKGIESLSQITMGAEYPLWRQTLYQIPKPREFNLSECCFGGIQLGQQYSDEELKNAIKTYQEAFGEYSYIDYSKDQIFNRLLQEALSFFGDIGEEVLQEFAIESLPYKVNCYPSGAIYLRDETDQVTTIILTGSKICNLSGLHVGLSNQEITGIYANPNEQFSAQLDIGTLTKALFDLEIDDIDLQGLLYISPSNDVRMEIISQSEESKLIVISID